MSTRRITVNDMPSNRQLKNTYGLAARNTNPDLKGMTLQSVMAIIEVNSKRVISLT
ncbi:hypothetical protein [Exiguobacterium sp. s133]|uniref:hypothetical protein n=1 Tax=Exiguobacterium sp. s133 TaxID=2751213 RepID=UPI001BE57425|nr:hypothetical protein [Exiguobacterium sp. s133]